jgi:Ca-activated chloride channel family protein
MKKTFLYPVICAIALIFISIGVMAPQFGKKVVDVKKKGVDIIIALDVSRSMLAQDIVPSRLERAKLELSNLISQLKGDRVGVILFAGQAFMQVPLTTDYDAARLFLKNVSVDSVPVQGTNFKSAFLLAKDMFTNSQQTSGAKVLLLLTDGEDHEGNYEQIIEEFKTLGIRVYAIGIGTISGEPVPDNTDSGKTYKKDKTGQIVVSRLNEGLLKRITSITGGSYIQGSNNEIGVFMILDELRRLKKGEISTREVYDYVDRYWIFALISFLLLLYSFLMLPFSKRGINISNSVLILLVVFVFMSSFSPFLRENPETKQGNELYKNGKFGEAAEQYSKAMKKLNREPLLYYNRASALIKDKKYNEAFDELKKAIAGADDKLKSKIYYNMGNMFLEQQKYDEAIDSYIKSIQYDKEFVDPKHNLEMVLRMMKDKKKEERDDKQDKKEEQKKEEEKKKEADQQERKDNQKPEQQKENMDIAKAEQLLDSLKEKETEQPFSKFLLKEFSNINVEKDW